MEKYIKKVTEYFGCNHEQIIPLSSGFQNDVFLYRGVNKEWILRLSRRRSKEELNSELKFLDELKDFGVTVAGPIHNNVIEFENHLFMCAFEVAKGERVDVTDSRKWNKRMFYNWGKIMGKMHSLSKQFPKMSRKSWSEHSRQLYRMDEPPVEDFVNRQFFTLQNEVNRYYKNDSVYGLIHNDFHQGNFYVKNNVITLFDFDDCAYNWFAQDIAASIFHAYWQSQSFLQTEEPFSTYFIDPFFDGYRSEHFLSNTILHQTPIFLQLRDIFLYSLFKKVWANNVMEDWQSYTILEIESRIKSGAIIGDMNQEFWSKFS
ncbi:phosphotransferase enzyme family protein [Peribacillus acanthi]|uniref:phosphotransferase enzyme family protein n=1 Tax=Peribacillus acanthi TaxID=2171554 RepID=UPI000D3E7ADF|nr:phosphotransferase [Peribacillus acanthi]